MKDAINETGASLDKSCNIFISHVNISRETLEMLGYSEAAQRSLSGADVSQPRSPHIAQLPVFPLTSNPSSKK